MGFEEKPQHGNPGPLASSIPTMVSASMGIYIFNTDVLLRALTKTPRTRLVPRFRQGRDSRAASAGAAWSPTISVTSTPKQRSYWRDVGTLDAYYEANMDLVDVTPEFNLYDQRWPIRTARAAAAAGQVRLRAGRPPHGRGASIPSSAPAASSPAAACCAACFPRACA